MRFRAKEEFLKASQRAKPTEGTAGVSPSDWGFSKSSQRSGPETKSVSDLVRVR